MYTFFKIYRKYKEETVAIFSIYPAESVPNERDLSIRLGNCKFHEEGINCVLYITS